MENQNNIDNMTTEELDAALKSGIDEIDGKASAESVEDSTSEPEPEKNNATEEAQAESEAESTQGDEGKDGEKEAENPYRKRIDGLLRKRDALTETIAEKEARIAALEAENEALKTVTEKQSEQESHDDSDIGSVINKVLDDREAKNKALSDRQKAIDSEFEKLVKKFPNAATRKSEILETAEKLPSLSFEAIDTMLAPADHVDPIEANRKNAKRMDISSRSRADLAQDKDMTKASTAEQEAYLREQIASGKLVI